MTPTEALFAVGAGFCIWQIVSAVRTYVNYERTKNLYVSEITCPKCHARPEVPCYFSNGYACTERWEAVRLENIVRKDRREQRKS